MLLEKAHNIMGPLSNERRSAIVAYLAKPTFAGWEEIHCYVISWVPRSHTIWQAVTLVDPSYSDIGLPSRKNTPPEKRWVKIPDPFTVARGIKLVLDGRASGR